MPKFSRYILIAITVLSIVGLAVVYIANGSEKEDLWLYISAAAIVLTIPLYSYPWKK